MRVDSLLAVMDAQLSAACRRTGQLSVPPEQRPKALLLMAPYRFLDRQPSEEAFDPTMFGKNRDHLEEQRLTTVFFDA